MTGAPAPTRSAEPRRQSDRKLIAYLAALSALSAMGVDIVLPAFAEMRGALDLPVDSNRLSLLIATYLFGLGAGQIVFGPIADRYGRKLTNTIGLSLFVVGAVATAFSSTLTAMIVFRLLMGLGSAAPRVMSMTIARDRFDGDEMTRVMTLVMAFFLMSPAIAPLIGAGLLAVGSWQVVFIFCAVSGGVMIFWTSRTAESLDPANLRPLSFSRTREGISAVFGNRQSVGLLFVLLFDIGAFFVYLTSAELMFEDVFDRADQFVYFFAIGAVVMALGNIAASRTVWRVGAQRMLSFVICTYLVCSVILFVITVAADGVPGFWIWVLLTILINAMHAVLLPTANSLAMQPLGAMAGTASGVIGTLSIVGGSVLASLVAARVDGSATPLAAAYLGFGLLGAAALVWSRRGASDSEKALSPTT